MQTEQDYPEAGISTVPSFTKYEELSDDNLDEWVENGFGEFDDVEERCVLTNLPALPCLASYDLIGWSLTRRTTYIETHSPVAYTIEGQEAPAAAAAASADEGEAAAVDDAALSAEIEARYAAYDEYYPPASFDAMVEAVKQSWRTIILSRGKQGAKAMREFYRDLHKAHPDLEEKVRALMHLVIKVID